MNPKGWISTSIGELDAYVTSGSRGWASYYSDEGDRFIRITNLQRDKIDLDYRDLKHVSLPKGSNEGQRTKLKAGDILVSITADLGIVGFIREEPPVPSYINQHIALTRIDAKEVDSEFIAYQLTSPLVQKRIQRLNDSGSKAGLSLDSIRNVVLDLPPLAEQKKIAEILYTWDRAINVNRSLIALLRIASENFVNRIFTPLQCKQNKQVFLSEVGEIISGGTPDTSNPKLWDGEIMWVTPTDITALKSKYLSSTARTITQDGLKDSSAKLLPKDSIVVCTRATVGELAITTGPMTTNQGFKSIVPSKSFDPLFVYYAVKNIKSEMIRMAAGSTFLEIAKKDFSKLKIPAPELNIQKSIGLTCDSLDREIEVLEELNDKIKLQKRGLMQKLLTGKVRVKV